MSYELFNPSTAISRNISRQFWVKALELAGLYGWQPRGTCPPLIYDFRELNADWLGGYLTNEGQAVSAEDALLLANTLESSLDDIPDENMEMDWNPKYWLEDDLPEWLTPEERTLVEEGLEYELFDIAGIHPFEYFAGVEKSYLVKLIRFCRLGSFMIF